MVDLHKMKTKELQDELTAKRTELRQFRFDVTGTKITNVKEGQNLRREIARLLTELKARETAE